jgi:uridylate kinase
LRIVLGDLAHDELIVNPNDIKGTSKPVVVAAGWKPGWSTDFDAVEMAKIVGAKKVINLSNIDYVYDKDPKVFKDAKKIENISWSEFRKIIPEKWQPGLNSPFDPIAAKNADEAKIEVAILNGKNITNLKSYLEGKDFLGTRIS